MKIIKYTTIMTLAFITPSNAMESKETDNNSKIIVKTFCMKRPCASINDIQKSCHLLLKRLDEQPVRTSGYTFQAFKAIPVENAYLCVTAETLCNHLETTQGKHKSWNVVATGPDQIVLSDNQITEDVIVKKVKKDNKTIEYPLAALYKDIKRTLRDIQRNWYQSDLEEYPDIDHAYRNGNWLLFVKPKILDGEHTLFTFLAHLLHCKHYMLCGENNSSKHGKMLHLLIYKDCLGRVVNALGLKIS